MEDHHNGIGTTEELEAMISDHGVLFREFRGDGYMVVGEENIFIVKDHEGNNGSSENGDDTGFEFSELSASHIHELHAERGYPSHRIERMEDAEVDEGSRKPCTEIKLWVTSHSIQFYVDAPVHKVAAAFVNFRDDE